MGSVSSVSQVKVNMQARVLDERVKRQISGRIVELQSGEREEAALTKFLI